MLYMKVSEVEGNGEWRMENGSASRQQEPSPCSNRSFADDLTLERLIVFLNEMFSGSNRARRMNSNEEVKQVCQWR